MYKTQVTGVLLLTALLVLGACAPTTAPEETAPALEETPAPAPASEEELVEEEEVVPIPASAPEETVAPTAEPALITKDASEMVLTIADFEPGWVLPSAGSTTKEDARSAYHVYFYDGSMLPYPPVIKNTTAVYPSVELAEQVYLDTVPQNVSLENPKIGDASFLDISIPQNKLLVFRKSNAVVWLWLQLDTFGFNDLKPYARIIEAKIKN